MWICVKRLASPLGANHAQIAHMTSAGAIHCSRPDMCRARSSE